MRFSLCGGGSDLPEFLKYEEFGQTLTTTLNKYVYVAIHSSSNSKYRFVYSSIEECETIDQVNHRILREVFTYENTLEKIELFSIADLPARGTGLGASSAFCLASVAAVNAYNLKNLSNLECARIASHVEMQLAQSGAGFQDQYASASGGLTLLEFTNMGLRKSESPCGTGESEASSVDWLNDHFVFVRSAGARDSSKILSEINFIDPKIRGLQREIRDLVPIAVSSINARDINTLGSVIEQNWELKKLISPASTNEDVDQLYRRGKENGAIGGKLLGAGGSGYIVFAVKSKEDFLTRMNLEDTGIVITGERLEVQVI
jgi:D-glycero-alpha-D-manno-heptose-7-phosphate kinase